MASDDKMLTAKQAGEMLGLSQQRVYTLINKGLLQAHDYNQGKGQRWIRIPLSAVEACKRSTQIHAVAAEVKPRYQ